MFAEFREARRLLRQAHIDRAGDRLDMDRPQSMRVNVEIGCHTRGVGELPVQAVGPLVIATGQPGSRAVTMLANLRTAMAAGIVESAQGTVLPAHDDHRRLPDREREVRAGFGNLYLEPRQDPVLAVDRRQVEREHVGIDIEVLRQCVLRLACSNQRAYSCQIEHGCFPVACRSSVRILAEAQRFREWFGGCGR